MPGRLSALALTGFDPLSMLIGSPDLAVTLYCVSCILRFSPECANAQKLKKFVLMFGQETSAIIKPGH